MKFLKIFLIICFISQIFVLIKYTNNFNIRFNLNVQLESVFEEPLILIGGSMSSGTTLMRSILDVHPLVKCGPETKISVEILNYFYNFKLDKFKFNFMLNAGLSLKTAEKALGLFLYYIYLNNVEKTKYLCNKEPANINYIEFFSKTFPKSKFIYMIRDGREVSYSLLRRTNSKINFENFFSKILVWNETNTRAYEQCLKAGKNYCFIVRYENLVFKPRETISSIAQFLDLKWTDKFLEHFKHIGKDIKISSKEWSLKKIKNEINNKSIGNWFGKIPNYNQELIKKSINMLKIFNYL